MGRVAGVARRALAQVKGIAATQALFNAIEECRACDRVSTAPASGGWTWSAPPDIRHCTACAQPQDPQPLLLCLDEDRLDQQQTG